MKLPWKNPRKQGLPALPDPRNRQNPTPGEDQVPAGDDADPFEGWDDSIPESQKDERLRIKPDEE